MSDLRAGSTVLLYTGEAAVQQLRCTCLVPHIVTNCMQFVPVGAAAMIRHDDPTLLHEARQYC
jgi:hypothetical protein